MVIFKKVNLESISIISKTKGIYIDCICYRLDYPDIGFIKEKSQQI